MTSSSRAQDGCWCDAPKRLKLDNNEVHVWRATLSVPEPMLQSFLTILDPDERAKAERFCFPRDRDRSIAARAVLRMILSRYLDVEPGLLQFCHNSFGKPALTGDSSADALRFNLSHSHELALYAVTRGREVGVDVEYLRADVASEEIAERFFSSVEVAMLRAAPFNMRTRAFFNCWTRKEAYIKGRGDGLSLPLDKFDVSLIPGEPAGLFSVRESKPEADGKPDALCWSLRELAPGPCYAGAVAAQGDNWQLKCWQWT